MDGLKELLYIEYTQFSVKMHQHNILECRTTFLMHKAILIPPMFVSLLLFVIRGWYNGLPPGQATQYHVIIRIHNNDNNI
jgi:hypothetical protein